MSGLRQNRPSDALFSWRSKLAIIVAGILLVSWGGPAASAFWSSINSGTGAAAADSVGQGARPATGINGANVTVTWTASTTAAGRSVTGYSIARYSSATGGTMVPATGGCAGTVAGLSCVEAGVPAGTWYYTVTPTLSLWQGNESQRSLGATPVTDTTPPLAPVLTAPAYVNQANVSSVPVSGTAEANSSVTLTVTGSGAQPVTQTLVTSGVGVWTAGPLNLSAFSDGTISYSARATDTAGNTGTAGLATSTKDVAVPTVTGVQLNNGTGKTLGVVEQGDSVTLTFSEALSATTICSAWTSNTATQTQSGNGSSQVLVNISAGDVLTVTQAGCPNLRVGSVALRGDYTATALTFAGNNAGGSILTWNPGARTLTITLGAGGPGALTVPAAPAPLPGYAPASGMTDIAGNPLATTQVNSLAASRF